MYIVNPNLPNLQSDFRARRTVWLWLLIPVMAEALIVVSRYFVGADGLDRFESRGFVISVIMLLIALVMFVPRICYVWAAVQAGKQNGNIVKVDVEEARSYNAELLTMSASHAREMTALRDKQAAERLALYTALEQTPAN